MPASGNLPTSGPQAQTERQRSRPAQPRGPDGRFAVVHGAYAGRRLLRQPDKRRSVVKQAAALRDFVARCLGYAGWGEMPEPQRGLVELAAELRIYRRLLAGPLWRREEPPRRYLNVGELERRVLLALGMGPQRVGPKLEEYLAQRYGERDASA